jgi:transposase-like protein
MAKALSLDLRQRVIEAIRQGMSHRQAAARFGVSASSAIRWAAQLRTTGNIAPKKQGGDRKSGRIEAQAAFLLDQVARVPDISLAELQAKLDGRHRHTLALLPPPPHHTQKKTAHAAEQQRSDVRAARQAWFEGQLDLDPERLVFIDGEPWRTAQQPRWPAFMVEPRGASAAGLLCLMAIGRPRPLRRACA